MKKPEELTDEELVKHLFQLGETFGVLVAKGYLVFTSIGEQALAIREELLARMKGKRVYWSQGGVKVVEKVEGFELGEARKGYISTLELLSAQEEDISTYRGCAICRHRVATSCNHPTFSDKGYSPHIIFRATNRLPTFCPLKECKLCGGKGMESWEEPFSQTTAAVCPDCSGLGVIE